MLSLPITKTNKIEFLINVGHVPMYVEGKYIIISALCQRKLLEIFNETKKELVLLRLIKKTQTVC